MKVIQNYHNEHTKFEFGMLIVVILYEFHTSHFAVHLFITPRIWQPEAMGLYAIIFDAVYVSSTLSSLLCTLGLT